MKFAEQPIQPSQVLFATEHILTSLNGAVRWVAEIARLAVPQAHTALEDLTDRALLVGDPTAQVFTLPSLAAQFLRAKRPQSVAQSGNRLSDRA